MPTLTPDAKQLLSRTVRELRARLLRDLNDEAERRYRLSIPPEKAKLPEDLRRKRERLDAWLDERARTANPKNKREMESARARFLGDAVKEAAATLLNRLVLLRHLEALGLQKPVFVTGGWNSKGYRELREFAPALLGDETEGYAAMLRLVFDELALELPGLFGDVGLTRLFAVPPATLREVVERLDDPGLEPAWTDDTTLGWVYQYWNDPEREALDAKLNAGGKIEPHEIASKTQMFTERYMVEWLLHNSLGLTWLCICNRNGWTADAEAVLSVLDARRAEWRKKREAGEVAHDALMPIEGELEEHWKYYVPQPIPDEAVASAPASIRALKLLDPACGSGHFLVIAFDLLAGMYREEARHRGEVWSDREIAEAILENNLHGIDIDPRAVQIAAAAVMLKAKRQAKDARPKRVNLVAPVLRLGNLPDDDPALMRLRREVRAETGIPEELTSRIVKALAGVDHLGSLLKVDATVDEAIADSERILRPGAQLELGGDAGKTLERSPNEVRAALHEKLEQFLRQHSGEEDLGLRLDGEQLAAGIRFTRAAREASYDVVVTNPPYQGTARISGAEYYVREYPRAVADLYAAFMERALVLARPHGIAALVTMRGWMYLAQFEELRAALLDSCDIRSLADIGTGAFGSRSMDDVISSAMVVVRRGRPDGKAIALQAAPLADASRDSGKPLRRAAALLCGQGRYEFEAGWFEAVEGRPIIYWWDKGFLARYRAAKKLGEVAPGRNGMSTQDNVRFLRKWWEVRTEDVAVTRPLLRRNGFGLARWAPYVKGAAGRQWFEPMTDVVDWERFGLAPKVFCEHLYGSYSRTIKNEPLYFRRGIAFTVIGSSFGARAHRAESVFGHMGASVFPDDIPGVLCLMNASVSKYVLSSLNPGLHFLVSDVNRLPVFEVPDSAKIYAVVEHVFIDHESGREASSEFRRPQPSEWEYAQSWAQRAVDRGPLEALPPYSPEPVPAAGIDHLSYAVGVALGRFGSKGEGVLTESRGSALPLGMLFISAALGDGSLAHAACASLRNAWVEHQAGDCADLCTWLRTGFFKHHKSVYENRPIYLPLSSAKKSFVAWVSIHRWDAQTLSNLLAEHLHPEKRRLEGELEDLRHARAKGEKSGKGKAEKRFADVSKLLEELTAFIDLVTECAERGPPPTSPDEPLRERDARYEMDLDDGVMVNSAALWPLLEPQWKDPKKWWKELATANGRKDYDWAHLAKRYFPERVEKKCVEDPSLAVAHGCFWRLHPAKAYAWELRLQDEIRQEFTIDEPGSEKARAAFLKSHADEAKAIRLKEQERRERKSRKSDPEENLSLSLESSEVEAEAEEVE
ncbi:conserved hypothetical protein [Anaeromyxobacter dehalogenans 2CP-1]|uniref:site-specific DNA-methyltransferase (adenine-specific) n=2 Tax=Anaeromyxobacter dehalogenans TaxID=161493 RepID=B8JFR3_ANAD2|nr:conserved hypothetical protein [Anaeromyxobacter dehalogenans 2CP-1]